MSLLRIVSIASLAVIALAGCSPSAPVASPTTPPVTSTPSPTPTPTAEPIVAPEPRLDLDCSDFGSDAEISKLAGREVVAIDYAAEQMRSSPGIPRDFALRQIGGMHCAWAAPSHLPLEFRDSNKVISISVLPDANTVNKWSDFVSAYGFSNDRWERCGIDEARTGSCGIDQLVGETWITMEFPQISVDDTDTDRSVRRAFAPFFTKAETLVDGAGSAGTAWEPPTDTTSLPEVCAQILPSEDVTRAIHAKPLVENYQYRDGPDVGMLNINDGALFTLNCMWFYSRSGDWVGNFAALPGGEWAWNESRDLPQAAGKAIPLELDGLSDGDSAYSRCTTKKYCVVDVILGHNWFQLQLDKPRTGLEIDGVKVSVTSKRLAALTKLANELVVRAS